MTEDNLKTNKHLLQMDFNACGTVEYSNETFNWNSNGENIIENMNPFIPENSEIKEVFEIKEDLLDNLKNVNFENKDFDIGEHTDKLDRFNGSLKDLLVFFKDQQTLVLKKEKELKDYYEKLEVDTQKITDFGNFLVTIDDKYKDFEATSINKSILEVSRKIKENNNGENLKEDYEKELSILNYYFHNFIKKINNGNLGNTCSLCLQRNVDTYMNPCGHTGCSQCINELKDRMGEYNCNCFICRKKVIKFNALYFI